MYCFNRTAAWTNEIEINVFRKNATFNFFREVVTEANYLITLGACRDAAPLHLCP